MSSCKKCDSSQSWGVAKKLLEHVPLNAVAGLLEDYTCLLYQHYIGIAQFNQTSNSTDWVANLAVCDCCKPSCTLVSLWATQLHYFADSLFALFIVNICMQDYKINASFIKWLAYSYFNSKKGVASSN